MIIEFPTVDGEVVIATINAFTHLARPAENEAFPPEKGKVYIADRFLYEVDLRDYLKAVQILEGDA